MMMTRWGARRRRGSAAHRPEPLSKSRAADANVSFKNCRRSSAEGGSYRWARRAKKVRDIRASLHVENARGRLQRKRENLRFCYCTTFVDCFTLNLAIRKATGHTPFEGGDGSCVSRFVKL